MCCRIDAEGPAFQSILCPSLDSLSHRCHLDNPDLNLNVSKSITKLFIYIDNIIIGSNGTYRHHI